MSFTHLEYDNCALQNKGVLNDSYYLHMTDKKIVNKKDCFQQNSPFSHNPFKSIPSEIIDIESDIKGQNRILTKDCVYDNNKYKYKSANDCKDVDFLTPEYTRLSKACNTLSDIHIDTTQPFCCESQDISKIQDNSFIGVNTRLMVRDYYAKNVIKNSQC